jgi:polyhydroxyalkanoate synthase subunit PhaC
MSKQRVRSMSDTRPAEPTAPPIGAGPAGAQPPGAGASGAGPTGAGSVNTEMFAKNLARIMEQGGKVLAAYLKPREEGKVKVEPAEETVEVIKTMGQVLEYWLGDPQRAVELQASLGKAYLELWAAAVKRMAGEQANPVAVPDPRDKRFADAEWSSNQFFDFLKQAYLLTVAWADHLVKDAKGLDPHTRQKAEFYLRQILNAISPSNFVLTNPELLRETVKSNAENLVRGMHMLAEDIEAGGGDLRIRQTNASSFEVGRNLALTPGKVIYQNDLMQLIQYEPTTEKVLKTPLLIVPPWINKFYILDLAPEKSFIKWCVDQGVTVFVTSWVNPDAHLAAKSFAEYMREGPLEAMDVIKRATGETQVHTMGYCVGGTLLSCALCYLAGRDEQRVTSATLLAAQVDFTHAGDLKVFAADEDQLRIVERRMSEVGYLEGKTMANAFNMLRSNDLIWPYVINTYLKGKEPAAFDLLFWNSDATRMPAANHSFYMRNFYLTNKLAKGELELGGIRLNLKAVKTPIYNLATREDHIAPAKSVYVGSSLFGGPLRFVLSGSGHIAGVVNPPGKQKYQYWTGSKPKGANVEAWISHAEEHPGSWWPDWLGWIKDRNADEVRARKPGSRDLPVIENAPGSYVKTQS